MNIRTRFAPSPTGFLHVGGLRTALYNYLFAKHAGGKLILRIEDTDQARLVEGATENLIRSLEWAGIEFDEGPHKPGASGPYVQSERKDLYQKHIEILLNQQDAYPCFCTKETLDEMRRQQVAKKLSPRYDGRCRRLTEQEVANNKKNGLPYCVRMKIKHTRSYYEFTDLIRGEVKIKASEIDDQVLLKSDSFPTYHFANVVDDHWMEISHVIRGEEWLSSVPKHMQLYEYFGWQTPQFAHLPLLLNEDRSKLSKRQGDVAVEDYKDKGFLPEGLVNFVALLGWSPKNNQELLSFEEMVALFSLENVNKAGAIFDLKKLNWVNQQKIKLLSLEELTARAEDFFPPSMKKESLEKKQNFLFAVRKSLSTLQEIPERAELFATIDQALSEELLEKIDRSKAEKILEKFLEKIQTMKDFSLESVKAMIQSLPSDLELKPKEVIFPLRLLLTKREQGPELPLIALYLGKNELRSILEKALGEIRALDT